MYKIVVFFIFCSWSIAAQQVKINGITTTKNKPFTLYFIQDFVSGHEIKMADTESDSMGRFQFNAQIEHIEKAIIRTGDVFSYLYLEPNSTYYIQFDENKLSDFLNGNEADLTFIRLDTTDINYKILSFEQWIDNALSILFPLKNKNSGEFIQEMNKFKQAANQLLNSEKNTYLRNYYKYTIGLNIEELNGFNSSSRHEKFSFFIRNEALTLQNEKLFEYVQSFYKQFFYEFPPEIRLDLSYQLEVRNFEGFNSILTKDSLVQNPELAELVGMIMLRDLFISNKINKGIFIHYLNHIHKNSKSIELRIIAQNLFSRFNVLEDGMPLNISQMELFKKDQYKNKYIYIHFFNPSNYLCISELDALNALYQKYKDYIEFITFYPLQKSYTPQELNYLGKINWVSYEIHRKDPIWKELNIQSFPSYILIDPNLTIESINAKSPTPNGKYETIEKTFFDIKQKKEGR